MSEAPLEPLDPDLAALFAKEREQGELPASDPEVVDRAIERAKERAESLGSSSSEPRPPSGQAPPSAPSGAQFGVKALALSGLVGALVGGAVTYAWVAPPASPAPVPTASIASAAAPPSASVAPSPDVSPSGTPAASAVVVDAANTAPSASASARPSASAAPSSLTASGDLVRERELVDAARAALSKGHPDETLRLLREHETRFASGQLAEEREALFVVAFARSGKKDAARGRLAAFRKAHPASPMLSTLDREVGDLDASP
jgi:hypothetical protein